MDHDSFRTCDVRPPASGCALKYVFHRMDFTTARFVLCKKPVNSISSEQAQDLQRTWVFPMSRTSPSGDAARLGA
jgi:hypothetical protein